MRIGIDVDGVLARYVRGYSELLVKTSGRDLFPTRPFDDAPTWEFRKHFGYTSEEIKATNKVQEVNPTFWYLLSAYDDTFAFLLRVELWEMYRGHEVYFITNRNGLKAKSQTERWLKRYGFEHPTVLITPEKGEAAHALGLDFYIDDAIDNVKDVMAKSPKTLTFLLDRPWNRDVNFLGITRTSSLEAFAYSVEAYVNQVAG